MFDPNIIIMLSTIAIIFYTVRSRRNTDTTVIKEKFKARLKGTISVTSCFASPFTLLVVPDQINAKYDQDYRNNTSYLALHVNQADARFSVKVGGKKVKIDDFIKKSGNDTSMGIDVGVQQTYWLSYDRERMTVSYGKGYPMNQTTMITFVLPLSDKEGNLGSLFAIDDQKMQIKLHWMILILEIICSPPSFHPPVPGSLIPSEVWNLIHLLSMLSAIVLLQRDVNFTIF